MCFSLLSVGLFRLLVVSRFYYYIYFVSPYPVAGTALSAFIEPGPVVPGMLARAPLFALPARPRRPPGPPAPEHYNLRYLSFISRLFK